MLTALVAILILALPLLLGLLFRNGLSVFLISFALILGYAALTGGLVYFSAYEMDAFQQAPLIFPAIIIATITAAGICLALEKAELGGKEEAFYDDRLFFRYGMQLQAEVIPVGQKEDFSESVQDLTHTFFHSLKQHLERNFGDGGGAFSTELISVRDEDHRSDPRIFIRSIFRTRNHSYLTYFINLSPIGKQIGILSLAYVRSWYHWYYAMLFIVSAPFHYWFWIYHWVRGKYSIRSQLGMVFPENSLDRLRIEAYFKTAKFTIMRSIEDFAKDHDLYTEELREVLINSITNTQNIQISKSKGIRIGRMKISNKTA